MKKPEFKAVKSAYAGAEWLEGTKRWIKGSRKLGTKGHYEPIALSELGALVADILGFVYRGVYHISDDVLRPSVKWDDDYVIQVKLYRDLATWDRNDLTELVILCHDCRVRLSLGIAPRMIELTFDARSSEGGISQGHPTIEEAIESVRARVELVPA